VAVTTVTLVVAGFYRRGLMREIKAMKTEKVDHFPLVIDVETEEVQ
jgi:hypothetical protein